MPFPAARRIIQNRKMKCSARASTLSNQNLSSLLLFANEVSVCEKEAIISKEILHRPIIVVLNFSGVLLGYGESFKIGMD